MILWEFEKLLFVVGQSIKPDGGSGVRNGTFTRRGGNFVIQTSIKA